MIGIRLLPDGTQQKITPRDLIDTGIYYEEVQPHAHDHTVSALMKAEGYTHQDTVSLSPDTPGLEEMESKFWAEHKHTEDEVRLITGGRGEFQIRPSNDTDDWFCIQVYANDLLVVPAGRYHKFRLLGTDKAITAIRLFKDEAGWDPLYRQIAMV